MAGKGHKPECQCSFCKKGRGESNNESAIHIRNWSRSKCEDEIVLTRYNILVKVKRMSADWLGLVELNKRKERIEIRLEELGIKLKDR